MVLGFGEGQIEITTDKSVYHSGETMKGQLKLTLNNPLKAKELRLLFYGEVHQSRRDSRGHRHSSIRHIYEHKISLSGEKEYPAGVQTYDFEFGLPDVPKPTVGIALGPISIGQPDQLTQATWYLDASLDISLSFDVNKKVRIEFVR